MIEQVSAQVHATWMDAKRAAGVTTRKLESGEELMVPYDQLSEHAKDLDRGTVRSVLSALPTLGYDIVPRAAPPQTTLDPIGQLRRGCNALYLEVPESVADGMKALAEAVIALVPR